MALCDDLSPLQSSRLSPLSPERRSRFLHRRFWTSPLALRLLQPSILRNQGSSPLSSTRPLHEVRESRTPTNLRPSRRGRIQTSLSRHRYPCLSLPQLPPPPVFRLAPQAPGVAARPNFHRGLTFFNPSSARIALTPLPALQYTVRGERFFRNSLRELSRVLHLLYASFALRASHAPLVRSLKVPARFPDFAFNHSI